MKSCGVVTQQEGWFDAVMSGRKNPNQYLYIKTK